MIAWLAKLGLDQWQGDRERQRTHLLTDLSTDTVYVVERERVVATITLDEFADADFWRVGSSVFRKVRTVTVAGCGSGALLARPADDGHGGGPTLVDLRDARRDLH